jgi:hypothetical protein
MRKKKNNMKITDFLKITDINQIFKSNLVSKYTRIKIYKILARPTLAYGSESWTIQSNDRKRLISAEMRFIRRTLGYTLFDHKRNEELNGHYGQATKNYTNNRFCNTVPEKLERTYTE